MIRSPVSEKKSASATAPLPAAGRSNLVQRKCACGGSAGMTGACDQCSGKKRSLQRQASGHAEPSAVPSIVHDVLRSPGQPIDAATRAFMEPRLGHDFSRVRVHTDAQAAESARAVNAVAFTVGRDVVFGARQYVPHTSAGRKLLAHELTHVAQQSNNSVGGGSLTLGEPDSLHEREADSVSALLGASTASHPAANRAGGLSATQSGVVQRLGPAGAAAAGAAAGAAIAVLSFEAALDYAKSMSTKYPGWLGALPNCPCTEAAVKANPSLWGQDANPILSYFHPGAATSYRSNSTYATAPGTAHGQQCTYDKAGNLITDGPGAGTPDSWSAVTNGASHFLYDVSTWQVLGWKIYTQYWQPNNGNGCAGNRGENTLGRRISEFLP